MQPSALVCAALLLLRASVHAQNLGKTPLYSQGLSAATDDGFLPHASFTLAPASGAQLQQCNAQECQKANSTLTAALATYCDHATPVLICVCAGVGYTLSSLADAYSITPLFLRQNVSVLTAVPATAASAYTSAHAVTVFTQVQPDVFVHESTHAQDGGFSRGTESYVTGRNAQGQPDPNAWSEAIAADSCVPDAYANTNAVEDLAQATVVWVYSLWKQPPAPGTGCMNNQMLALNRRQAAGMQQYQQAVRGGTFSQC